MLASRPRTKLRAAIGPSNIGMTKRNRHTRNRLRDDYPMNIPSVDLAPQVDSLELAYILVRHKRLP